MKIGYARVSTSEQDTHLQIAALRAAHVHVFWEEQASGAKERPELEQLLNHLQPGDELIVYKIDRLARSLHDLLRIADRIAKSNCTLRSLTEPIETLTPVGRMLFQLLGAFAEFERNVIRERCEAGREAAKARGVKFGPKPRLNHDEMRHQRQQGMSLQTIAVLHRCSHVAVLKALRKPPEQEVAVGSMAAESEDVSATLTG